MIAQALQAADLAAMIESLKVELVKLTEHAEGEREFRRVLILLANQTGDLTHATIETAANIKRVSVCTIRRKIRAGEYTLEAIPGRRISGIPIEQLSDSWVPIRIARRAYQKQKMERANAKT